VARNLYYKYRKDTPIVIKGISFTINPYEKVGVVGRTGSGKSTLTLGLLRILELHNKGHQDPAIEIDGVDVSAIGLHHLR
jgi:ABC-type multidrug transport system fused ATPase/permease subunit